MGHQPSIYIFNHSREIREQSKTPLREIAPETSFGKINQALFGPLNSTIITANEVLIACYLISADMRTS